VCRWAELEGVGSWRVIEADDREVTGDAQTEPPGGLQGIFSEPAGHAEETSGSRSPGQERGGVGGCLLCCLVGHAADPAATTVTDLTRADTTTCRTRIAVSSSPVISNTPV
jgi:hypothetical protein